MLTRLTATLLLATSLMTTQAGAQATCAPEKLNAAIDVYANEPFGARAWRKMTGLGDAGIAASNDVGGSYATTEEWKKFAAEILPSNTTFQNPSYNCRLRYPLDVLKARIASYGKTNDYVKQWAMGQEAVLVACAGETPSTDAMPAPPATLKPADVALLAQDRDYQRASVLFYQKPTDAVQAFRAIAASNSPHKAAARYNIANLLANAKNVVEARAEAKAILADPALSSVHDITRALLGYIANLEDTAPAWTELIDQTVETLSRPAEAVAGKGAEQEQLANALYDIDYVGVTAKQDDWWITNTLPANPTLSRALADSARKHPMVLWMMAGQSVYRPMTQAPWALIGPKWQAWSQSYVDRAQSLQSTTLPPLPKIALESLKAGSGDADRSLLWSQAQMVADKAGNSCGEAPETGAVALLASQATRVSALAGRYDEIYTNLPKLKLEGGLTLRDSLLPKLMQHVLATGDVEEGRRLRDAMITEDFLKGFATDDLWKRGSYAEFLSWVAEDEQHFLAAVGLMAEKLSPTVFNFLPAGKLRDLGDNAMFSAQQKALLKRAAWTRNYARGIEQNDKTTTDMLAANPEIAAALEAVKKEYPKLKASHALALTILRNPRFGVLVNSPDSYETIETPQPVFSQLSDFDANDKNWWCPLEPDRQLLALRTQYDAAADLTSVKNGFASQAKALLEADALAKTDAAREGLLKQHSMVKAMNWKEVASLAKAPSAPKLLTQAAIRMAKAAKPDNVAAAESLALAVRSTRYGCRWHGSHEAYSKPAQELLKSKFATSSWAAQTPYWFGCMDAQYDAKFNKVTTCKPRAWAKQALPK
jgi:GrpB-like predicted nucleotidyltransferase (UPF0157 family)